MILDASVAAGWFLRGKRCEAESLSLRRDYEDGKFELEAPLRILYEVCNAIWKRMDVEQVCR